LAEKHWQEKKFPAKKKESFIEQIPGTFKA
jgi:hypothetical protein